MFGTMVILTMIFVRLLIPFTVLVLIGLMVERRQMFNS